MVGKLVIVIATLLIAVGAVFYVDSRIEAVKQRVVYKRRKARQAKLLSVSANSLPNVASGESGTEVPKTEV